MASNTRAISLQQLFGPAGKRTFVSSDNRRFCCPHQHCQTTCARPDQVQRHYRTKHGSSYQQSNYKLDYTTVVVRERNAATGQITNTSAAQYVDRIWQGHTMPLPAAQRGQQPGQIQPPPPRQPVQQVTVPLASKGDGVVDMDEGMKEQDAGDVQESGEVATGTDDADGDGDDNGNEGVDPNLEELYQATKRASTLANQLLAMGYRHDELVAIMERANAEAGGGTSVQTE